jgi:molybdenum cofactor cytidylyltransferase
VDVTMADAAADPAVAAIVLAAGRATRMGSQKLLLDLDGRSLIRRVVDAALGSRATKTVVVVGHEGLLVRRQLVGMPVTVVENSECARGMSTSLQAGVRAAGQCDGVIVLLGDQPYVTAGLIDQLIEGFARTRSVVVRPLARSRPANPVLLSAALFPGVFAQTGDVGGREIVDRHADEVLLVPLDDPGAIVDIDSPEDYARVRAAATEQGGE